MKILKIKRTSNLREKKKLGGENEHLRQISKSPSISLFFFHFSPLSFNSIIPPKKICN
jgi:hypothetical protein